MKPRIHVKWVDACHYNGWQTGVTTFEPVPVETVGFLVEHGGDYVSVANSVDSNGQWADVISIPRSCITDYEVVEWPNADDGDYNENDV